MKKIQLIQTGGTIAMHSHEGKPELDINKFTNLLHKEIPELSEIADLSTEQLFFKDSSDITPGHWKTLSLHIRDNYERFDGFVVLHGTDTMAYTASALSFSLTNLGKPIIFTGSQVPMSNIRSDAHRNVINAVELATHPVFDVAICFNDTLFRGNRSTKMSIGDFNAFTSPNYPSLAEVGIEISLNTKYSKPSSDLRCNPLFDNSIHVVKIYPGLNPEMLSCIDLSRTKAVILEAFGSGNVPVDDGHSLIPFMETCREYNCHVIITSQAPYDSVDLNQYKSGREAKKIGALSAGDMTMEATITKVMYLLGEEMDEETFRSEFERNIAGER
ncbi:asparaginase [Rhodohalobacter sp. SW132]|uniref:asparaginase n=1 Tax=Rhodohalobacter sp. SW132 TaxID=2293433 RepID=UPI000E22CDB5|nr:asparaginase [Rhodohalobacter sp. SW132]REL24330.1 asparaginase [Rhodohalobacter sp. SW132]